MCTLPRIIHDPLIHSVRSVYECKIHLKSQLDDEMMSIFFNLQSIKLIMNYTTFSLSLADSSALSQANIRSSRWEGMHTRPVMFRTLYYISRVIRLTLKQLHKADIMFNNSETNENCNKIYYQKTFLRSLSRLLQR